MLIGICIGVIAFFSILLWFYIDRYIDYKRQVMILKSTCLAHKKIGDSSDRIIKLQDELIGNQKSIIETKDGYIKQLEDLLNKIEKGEIQ